MERDEVNWQDVVGLTQKLEKPCGDFTDAEMRVLRMVFDVAGESPPGASLTGASPVQSLGTIFLPGSEPDRTRRAVKVFGLFQGDQGDQGDQGEPSNAEPSEKPPDPKTSQK